jgi:hypothetical protein
VGPVAIDHHTLVDELWNDSRIFLRQGNLSFRQNEARKYREDCHRLTGEKGSAIVYYAAGGIRRVRAFAFGQNNKPELIFATSFDARSFQPANTRLETPPTNLGKDLYGSWKTLVYTLQVDQPGTPFVRIEFQGDTQIGRIEVGYGDAERG